MHNYHLLCPIDTQTMSLWLIDHWKPLGHVFPPSSPPLFHASSFFPTHYSVPMLCPALRESMDCSTPGSLSFTISQSLLKLMSIEQEWLYSTVLFCFVLFFCHIVTGFLGNGVGYGLFENRNQECICSGLWAAYLFLFPNPESQGVRAESNAS